MNITTFQCSQCGICGWGGVGRSGTGFSLTTSDFPCQNHYANTPFSFMYHPHYKILLRGTVVNYNKINEKIPPCYTFFSWNPSHCAVTYIYIYIYITVKHNKPLIISSINATCFGLSGPSLRIKMFDLKHK